MVSCCITSATSSRNQSGPKLTVHGSYSVDKTGLLTRQDVASNTKMQTSDISPRNILQHKVIWKMSELI